jgi:hypothetical protein
VVSTDVRPPLQAHDDPTVRSQEAPGGSPMLDHLTPQALVTDRQSNLRRDAAGLRNARLSRRRRSGRRGDRSPTDDR